MAPLNVPLERRLQTLATLIYGIEPSVVIGFFIFLWTIPFLWPILIAYVIWIIKDEAPVRGGRRIEWVRRLKFWKYFAEYFPVNIIKESDLDPSKNYIFGYHPHGILAYGAVITFATEGNGFSQQFPGIETNLMTLHSNFKMPFHRDYLLSLGICSVSRKSCKYILQRTGRSIAIVVGGATESLHAYPGIIDLTLKKRLGFVKIAVETGASLVPVLSFGENDIYDQIKSEQGSWLWLLQKRIQAALGFTMPLFHGRGIFNYDIGLMPHRKPLNVVFGNPIDPPSNVSDEEKDNVVQDLHTQYMNSLQAIWDKYKDDFAPNRVQELAFVG
ncbi:diacylglycerol acyltransferase type 2A [Halteromyces radiatus]|uniref:diacylglycerol acyltransferase type 2A n=1 Tax=Halteromyces radiatus TaxID=101107 RepID=UPI00221EB4CA|nr:diacylglycerol acyltransferase type 2A [Halteromyces radiatus]KAI8097116.1 diacylglycerol acyltransferase type 2A [Halteromyces radiatus]